MGICIKNGCDKAAAPDSNYCQMHLPENLLSSRISEESWDSATSDWSEHYHQPKQDIEDKTKK